MANPQDPLQLFAIQQAIDAGLPAGLPTGNSGGGGGGGGGGGYGGSPLPPSFPAGPTALANPLPDVIAAQDAALKRANEQKLAMTFIEASSDPEGFAAKADAAGLPAPESLAEIEATLPKDSLAQVIDKQDQALAQAPVPNSASSGFTSPEVHGTELPPAYTPGGNRDLITELLFPLSQGSNYSPLSKETTPDGGVPLPLGPDSAPADGSMLGTLIKAGQAIYGEPNITPAPQENVEVAAPAAPAAPLGPLQEAVARGVPSEATQPSVAQVQVPGVAPATPPDIGGPTDIVPEGYAQAAEAGGEAAKAASLQKLLSGVRSPGGGGGSSSAPRSAGVIPPRVPESRLLELLFSPLRRSLPIGGK